MRILLIEAAVVLLGVALRVAMAYSFLPQWGYDFFSHKAFIDWLIQHQQFGIPPHETSVSTAHPPLYYWIAALPPKLGGGYGSVVDLSVAFGVARLGLFWWALRRLWPDKHVARIAALAIVAVLPSSIHIEACVGAESFQALLTLVALVMAYQCFSTEGRLRIAWGAGLGAVLGALMLVKISAAITIAAIGSVALLELAFSPRAEPRSRAAAVAVTGIVIVIVSGWYYVRNTEIHGKPFITSFEVVEKHYTERLEKTPLLTRRPLRYFIGWSNDIFDKPYWPSAIEPSPRFLPVLLATSFVDYYNLSFAGRPPEDVPRLRANTGWVAQSMLWPSRISMASGAFISLLAAVAFVVASVRVLRQRRFRELAMLAVPLAAVVGQAYFSLKYPLDQMGVVKGTYVIFAFPPVFALFGLTMEWLVSRKRAWASALVGLSAAAVAGVGLYSVWATFERFSTLP